MYYLFLIFSIFISTNLLALESSDVLDTKILKVYDKNILVLDRGLEDAIFKKDHIKITSRNGFIARGICIKASLLTSHWKIYRVVRPELISKDTLYKMRSINQSEMPKEVKVFSNIDFSKYFNNYGDKDIKKELKLQEKRIAEYDLPEKVELTKAFKGKKQSQLDQFIDKAFEPNKFKADIGRTYVNIFASPFTWQTRYNQKEHHYGATIFNRGEKYLYEINAVEAQKEILDPITGEGYKSKSTYYDFTFTINKLNDYISIFAFAAKNKEKIGETYYPYDHTQFGPLGLTLHLWDKDPKDNYLELSYIPVFDNFSYNDPNTLTTDDIVEREGIRHRIRLRYRNNIFQNAFHQLDILYSKYNVVNESEVKIEDTKTNIVNTFSYHMGNDFYTDYKIDYEKDELRAEIYDISQDNLTQTIRFRYEFDI